ncbi:MAG: 16S rRNA (uracil(1498)-N(3))-methyltransferase [Victivallales bacterium]|jgi:16S rRNA (uracil1498-N3)-methyltransferase|nr:16S rRNA (uracil(1498)-N(3))-methyltransferase [Victivallales bacterium]
MHTFFTEKFARDGEYAMLLDRERDHLFKTLRAKVGDQVELFDGRGGRMLGVVSEQRSVKINFAEQCPVPQKKLHLCCAVPKRAKFDTLLKQAAELGVWSILLIECERSVAKPEGSERWHVLLQEGCKQSKNPFLPQIESPIPLSARLQELKNAQITPFFGAIRSEERMSGCGRELAWLVGPEGGFTDAEESLMRSFGVRGLNLGPYVLRLETAAVCGLAVLRQSLENDQ